MRRVILLAMAIIVLLCPVFADNTYTSYISADIGDSVAQKSAEIEYVYTPSKIGDSFRVGFTHSPVTGINDNPTPANDVTLTPQDDFSAALESDLYIYWQIASTGKGTITLTPTRMTNTDSDDVIDISLTTTKIRDSDDGYAHSNQVTSDVKTPELPLLVFDGSSKSIVAGSQKIEIKTVSSLFGIADADYTGTLTATVKTGN